MTENFISNRLVIILRSLLHSYFLWYRVRDKQKSDFLPTLLILKILMQRSRNYHQLIRYKIFCNKMLTDFILKEKFKA